MISVSGIYAGPSFLEATLATTEKSSWTRYIPAIIAAIIAIVAIVMASIKFSADEPEDWTQLIEAVAKLETAAAQAEEVAVKDQRHVECIATKATRALVVASIDGLKSAQDGSCKIPDADVDVSACLAWAPAAEAYPAAEADPAAEAAADETATLVDGVVGIILPLIPAAVDTTKAPENAKAWVKGVSSYLDSARPTILALAKDPSSGKFHATGQVIEGCVAH